MDPLSISGLRLVPQHNSIFGRSVNVFTILFNCRQEYESKNRSLVMFLESRSEISPAMAPLAAPPRRIEAVVQDFARYRKSGAP
jgi:hypothetical protein